MIYAPRRRPQARTAARRVSMRGPVLRNGVRLGVIYVLCAVVDRVAGTNVTVEYVVRVVSALAGAGYLFVVGRVVAQRGARLRQAALAGALAGGLAWLIDAVVLVQLYRLSPAYYLDLAIANAQLTAQQAVLAAGQSLNPATMTPAEMAGALVIGLAADLALSLGFGAFFATVGWLVVTRGRKRSSRRARKA